MKKLGMVMDPIQNINPHKDTSFAMLLEAQRRGWKNYYIKPQEIWLQDGIAWGRMAQITVVDNLDHWFDLGESLDQSLVNLDVLFMRKDPPFDMDYIYLTYLLEQAEAEGLLVINKPASLRNANEKLFTLWFPQCCPKTLVTSQPEFIREFISENTEAIIKPLHGMGGVSIFRLRLDDPNLTVILENMTAYDRRLVMVQQFIPEISAGDKRVLMIDGKPVPYALARIPVPGDFRGNLAAGATARAQPLTTRDQWICEQVGTTLRDKGLLFVGLDIIGDYLTEINVTSPTCARELDREFNLNICGKLMDVVDKKIS